jgi:hypothetical protein
MPVDLVGVMRLPKVIPPGNSRPQQHQGGTAVNPLCYISYCLSVVRHGANQRRKA